VKRARVLSRNKIQEIAMDSDSDEDKHYTSHESEDEREPRPPSRQCSFSRPFSPDYFASSSEGEGAVGNVAVQQPQPSLCTLPPKPQRRVVHTFIGAPNGNSSEAAHITKQSTPLSLQKLLLCWLWSGIVTTTSS
jgi:hypothetical protein